MEYKISALEKELKRMQEICDYEIAQQSIFHAIEKSLDPIYASTLNIHSVGKDFLTAVKTLSNVLPKFPPKNKAEDNRISLIRSKYFIS